MKRRSFQQPYRARAARQQTAALRSMQKGRHPLKHIAPNEVRRRAMKKPGRRKGRARYSSPMKRALRVRQRVGG